MAERAERVLAGGAAHDSGSRHPASVTFERGEGAYKWTSGGRRVVDLCMGHGSLLQGHAFQPVSEAARRQIDRGLHFSGLTELQLAWAEKVCRLVPSAESVRFTSSGTEATLLAMRIARAVTGRPRCLKFDGHFHGWHDEGLAAYDGSPVLGSNPGVAAGIEVASLFDLDELGRKLSSGEIAGVILEPAGGASGALPFDVPFLKALRSATSEAGSLLIFDEMVSGFRYSPGGAQAIAEVIPDLTCLGKILAGGFPGAAVVGPRSIMSVLGGAGEGGKQPAAIIHSGTFNGFAVSAAAGLAMVESLADGEPQVRAAAAAESLAGGINEAAAAEGIDVRACRSSSILHFMIGAVRRELPIAPSVAVITLYSEQREAYEQLRAALFREGVDTHPLHGWISAAHDGESISEAEASFARAFRNLAREAGFSRLRTD